MASSSKITKVRRAIRENNIKKARIRKVRAKLGKYQVENGLLVSSAEQSN